MNDGERAICARVRFIREQIKWSQTNFAKELEITRPKLVSIEAGHTPLRYNLAVKISRTFDISAKWIATGVGEMRPYVPLLWTQEFRAKFKENDLLSSVYKLRPGVFEPFPKTRMRRFAVRPDFDFWNSIDSHVKSYCYTLKFHDLNASWDFAQAVGNFLMRLSDRSVKSGKATKITKDSVWAVETVSKLHKKALTDVYVSVNNLDVKSLFPKFIERVKGATSDRGSKTKLAKFLGVPLASVSQWLSGEREPGGETTLKLLHWVEQQERQK